MDARMHTHAYTHTLYMYVVDEMMVALLDSGQREMVYCACGVLVNLMADPTHRDILATNSGIRKLVKIHLVQKNYNNIMHVHIQCTCSNCRVSMYMYMYMYMYM
jgi:hypothetical protein